MPDFPTVSELLSAQSEKKLVNMRTGVVNRIENLGLELRLIDEAISRKRRARVERPDIDIVTGSSHMGIAVKIKANGTRTGDGRFEGLPREQLLAYVAEIGHPTSPPEVSAFLVTKGVVRSVEAVRVALRRAERAGAIERTSDGKLALASSNGDGAQDEPAYPLSRERGREPVERPLPAE